MPDIGNSLLLRQAFYVQCFGLHLSTRGDAIRCSPCVVIRSASASMSTCAPSPNRTAIVDYGIARVVSLTRLSIRLCVLTPTIP